MEGREGGRSTGSIVKKRRKGVLTFLLRQLIAMYASQMKFGAQIYNENTFKTHNKPIKAYYIETKVKC